MPMKVRYTVVNGVVRSENRSGVERAYSLDPLGNTRALYDTTATRTDTFEYFPSGTVASRTGTTATPFQWVGGSGYYRDNAKRVHVRARNFYVNLGRWAETDPIGFRGGDYNLYRYVKNRFVVMTDPSGLVVLTPVNKDNRWRMGKTAATVVKPTGVFKSNCCCGGYKGVWSLELSRKVNCKGVTGYFAQYITFKDDNIRDCKTDKIDLKCKAYIELFPVDLTNDGRLSGVAPEDTFLLYVNANKGKNAPNTSGTFSMIGEAKFFCSEDVDRSGFLDPKTELSPKCNGWSGSLEYKPIEGDLPEWWNKASRDGTTAKHSSSATWNCCKGQFSDSVTSLTPSGDVQPTNKCPGEA